MKLQGIFPALATPFDDNGDVHVEKLKFNLSRLNQVALSGYLVGGSTGESPLLSTEEKLALFEQVREVAPEGRTLIAGIGYESVRNTLKMAEKAAGLGYRAGLVLTPSYYTAIMQRPETQKVYFKTIADGSPIPILIYNMPAVTGYDMPVEVIAELSQHPNILGMKDSSGNVAKLKETVAAVKPGFQVLSGSGMTFCDALYAGASGAILAIANAVPYACVTVWEAFRMRQEEAARDWQQRLFAGAKLVPGTHGVAGLKHLMDAKGYFGGLPRLPLTPVSESSGKQIEQAFEGINN